MGDDFSDFEGVETYRLPSPRSEPTPSRWLLILSAEAPRAIELVAGAAWTIGRSTQCEIAIADRAISRRHALLRFDHEVVIEDLGSANGLVVAGRTVAPRGRAQVPVGSAVQIGTALLVVHVGEPPVLEAEPAPPGRAPEEGRVVADPAMERAYELVARVAPTRLNVLLLGETGVGKEVFAEAVHASSPRATGPFVRINCAALSPQLLESELFGHERGAFTGADRAREGLLEAAHGGTLLLDEIGEMPLALQAKLLRVVEQLEVKRVGAVESRTVDVRFVAATNRDLEAEVALGSFRRDLYYRLNGISIEIPPLRDRPSEVLPLAARFLEEHAVGAPPAIDDEARAALLRHHWPGNVRELRNVMERAAAFAGRGPVGLAHLPPEVVGGPRAASRAPSSGDLREDLAEIERRRIIAALAECDGNQTKAARLLGMPRRTLISRIEEYGLPRPRKGRKPG